MHDELFEAEYHFKCQHTLGIPLGFIADLDSNDPVHALYLFGNEQKTPGGQVEILAALPKVSFSTVSTGVIATVGTARKSMQVYQNTNAAASTASSKVLNSCPCVLINL